MWLGDAKIFGWQVKMYKCGCVFTDSGSLPAKLIWAVVFWCHTLLSIPPEKEEAQPARMEVQKGRLTGKNETRGWGGMKGRTTLRLPRRCGGKEFACQCRETQEMFNLWVRSQRKWQPLENPLVDRRVWWATVPGATESHTTGGLTQHSTKGAWAREKKKEKTGHRGVL